MNNKWFTTHQEKVRRAMIKSQRKQDDILLRSRVSEVHVIGLIPQIDLLEDPIPLTAYEERITEFKTKL